MTHVKSMLRTPLKQGGDQGGKYKELQPYQQLLKFLKPDGGYAGVYFILWYCSASTIFYNNLLVKML